MVSNTLFMYVVDVITIPCGVCSLNHFTNIFLAPQPHHTTLADSPNLVFQQVWFSMVVRT